MDANHHIWEVWAKALNRWGIDNFVATFLEAAGPLSLLGAQAVYLSQPILNGVMPARHIRALVDLFEDNTQRQGFITLLRGDL